MYKNFEHVSPYSRFITGTANDACLLLFIYHFKQQDEKLKGVSHYFVS